MASLQIDNWNLFYKAVAQIVADVWENDGMRSGDKARWNTAIGTAVGNIESDDFLMHWQSENETLLIYTATTSGQVYEAGQSCQCEASKHAVVCWHIAAARIVKRYMAEFLSPLKNGAAAVRRSMAAAAFTVKKRKCVMCGTDRCLGASSHWE